MRIKPKPNKLDEVRKQGKGININRKSRSGDFSEEICKTIAHNLTSIMADGGEPPGPSVSIEKMDASPSFSSLEEENRVNKKQRTEMREGIITETPVLTYGPKHKVHLGCL